jgi:thiamine pyrophosphate-dependent acetolactate synthase large subunit-like protein
MPTEVPLVGDAAATLQALLPLLEAKADRGFLEQAQQTMAAWREDVAALESPDRDPIQPQYLMGVVNRLAGDDAILCCDSGTIATWAARHWTIRGDRQFYLSGNLATMAPGLPYAIACQWAFPGRQCIAFIGDGGLAMLMAELATAARYDLPVKVVVNNNASLGQIEWEQVVLGYPEYGVRFERSIDFAQVAQACGASGVRVERAGDLEGAVRAALDHPGPALVDCIVNPHEPPVPGKIEFKQAKGFAKAFLRGQPDKLATARTIIRDQVDKLRG